MMNFCACALCRLSSVCRVLLPDPFSKFRLSNEISRNESWKSAKLKLYFVESLDIGNTGQPFSSVHRSENLKILIDYDQMKKFGVQYKELGGASYQGTEMGGGDRTVKDKLILSCPTVKSMAPAMCMHNFSTTSTMGN